MSATLQPTLPGGTIKSQDSEADFQDWVSGKNVTRRMLLIEVEATGVGGASLERGRVTKTKYGAVHAVEIRDPHEIDQLRHRITQIRADQGFATKQPRLYDATDAEQCESLIDMIKDWASEQDIPLADLDKQFVDAFGGKENANAETVQACRSPQLLKEFAFNLGVLDDNPVKDDAPGDDEGDDESEAAEEPTKSTDDESAVTAVGSVPFQEVTQ